MKRRCQNPNAKDYPRYGGRGITVCERWQSFENFLADMGERPAGMTIERNDANGNYEPGNCRWATQIEQVTNTSHNRMLTAFGETHALSVWATRKGIPRTALAARIAHGWPVEQALTSPVKPGLHRASR